MSCLDVLDVCVCVCVCNKDTLSRLWVLYYFRGYVRLVSQWGGSKCLSSATSLPSRCPVQRDYCYRARTSHAYEQTNTQTHTQTPTVLNKEFLLDTTSRTNPVECHSLAAPTMKTRQVLESRLDRMLKSNNPTGCLWWNTKRCVELSKERIDSWRSRLES